MPAQVHEQLAAREPPGRLPRPVHRQRRLPRPGGAVDGDHGGVPGRVEHRQFAVAAGEAHGGRGELPRHRMRCGVRWGRCRGQRPVAGEDLPLQCLGFRARVQAQLVGEHRLGPAVGGERVGLAAAAVEGEDELAGHALVERVGGGQLVQPRQQLRVPAAAEHDVVAQQEHFEPFVLQRRAQVEQPVAGRVGESGTTPEVQRFGQQAGVLGGPSPDGEVAEAVQVDRGRVGRQGVSAGAAVQRRPGGREDRPQPGDVPGKHVADAVRRVLAPDAVDQLLGQHGPADLGQQHRQHAALARMPGGHHPAVDDEFDGAEHPQLHPHPRPAPLCPGSIPRAGR